MLMSLLVAAASLAQPAAEPLDTCVFATIKRGGAISGGRVEVSSGNKLADRQALRHLSLMNVSRTNQDGVEPHSGYVLVRMHGPDMFTIELQNNRKLFNSCAEASESAQD